MNLKGQKVFGNKIEVGIRALVATPQYVAVGGFDRKVTVYDKEGSCLLVSYIEEI